MLTEKETGTVIFALEEYAQVLEKENSYEAKNNVLELIWKIDALSNQGVCDNCDDFYDLGSRENRCGNCGNCGSCCTHKGEGESDYGFTVEGGGLICPKCADNPLYEGKLERVDQEGYPDGYTCAECGQVKL